MKSSPLSLALGSTRCGPVALRIGRWETITGYWGLVVLGLFLAGMTVWAAPRSISGEAALAGTIEEALVLTAGARVWSDHAILNGEITVEEGAILEVPNARSLTVNAVLRNRGVIRMWSRQNGSSLLGKGRVENVGRFEVSQVPGWGEGAEAMIGLILENAKGGRVQVNPGGFGVVGAGGRIESASEVRIEAGGRLRFNEAEQGPRFELSEGAAVLGRGELRLDGASVLSMAASAVVESPLVLTGKARVEGRGVLTLRSEHQLTGLYLAPLAVESNAVANVIGATFSNRVDVLGGGTLTLHNGRVLELHAELANAGLIQMSSRQNGSVLRGTGRVLNAGVMQIYQVPGWGEGAEAVVAVGVEVLTAGRLVIAENGFCNFTAGSKLNVLGRVELQGGSRLRFDATEPARELVAGGGEFAGAGALVLDGANVAVIEKDTEFPQPLVLLGKSRVVGAASLVLRGVQGLTGRYEGALRVGKGARVTIENATMSGDLTVDEGGELVVPNARTLTLDGVCTNRGTIRMYSRQNGSLIQGAGRVENEGAFEVLQVPGWGEGAEAVVRVPVTTALTGRFTVAGAGFAAVAANVDFVVGGLLEMGRGGRLRLDRGDDKGAPRMLFRIGNKTVGDGLIQLDANELVMEADAAVPAPLALGVRSTVTGAGRLILQRVQALGGVYEAPLIVDAEATVTAVGGVVRGPMTVQRAGLLVIPNQQRLTLDGTLFNLGTVQMWSRQNGSTLDGRGRVNNAGVFEVSQVPGWGERAEARIFVLIDVLPPGVFRANRGGYASFGTAGSLSIGGSLQLENGSLLRLDEMEPGQVLTFQKGARNSGRGELRLDGKSRIVMAGDADIESVLVVGQNAWVQGPGTLRLRFEQWLTGSYLGPLTVGTNGVVNVLDATIGGRTLVEPGGRLGIHNGRVLRLDGELTNRGTVEMASRQNGSLLEGKGRMQNHGSFEVYQVPGWGEAAEARVRVPVTIADTGRLLVKSGGFFAWTGAGPLEVAGAVEVQANGRLRFDESAPGRDLVANGGQFSGPGQIRFDGTSRFVVNLETRLPSALSLTGTARVIANAPLVLADGQTLTGGYDGTLVVAKGASVTIDQARTTGLVRVEPGGLVIVPNGRTWFLDGPLTNRGTIRMYSRQNGTGMQGRGRIDNAGVFEVLQVPGWGEAAEAVVRVPAKTWETGRFVVAAGGFGAVAGGVDFAVAGSLELAGGGRLRFSAGDSKTTPRLVMQAGNRCSGDGALVLDGNELWLEADSTMPVPLVMSATSRVAGPGQLVLQRNQNLSGRYQAPVALDDGATAGGAGGVIEGLLTVRKGAVLTMHNAQVLTLHGVLRNEGIVRLFSRQNGSRIEGTGRIENEALIEISQVPGWGEAAEAALLVPVQGGSTSSFVVNGGGFAAVLAPGELLGVGSVRVLDRLRLGGAMRYHGTVEVRGALLLADAQSSLEVLNTLTFTRDASLSNPGRVCGSPLVDGGLRLTGAPPGSDCAIRGAVPLFAILANRTAPAGQPTPAYAFGLTDADSATGALKVIATSSATNLVDTAGLQVTQGIGGGSLIATPTGKDAGSTLVTLTATDAEGNRAFRSFNLAFSASTVPVENQAPLVSPIAGVSLEQGQTREVRFTVSDAETPAADLEVFVTSSAPSLFPTLATSLTGGGAERVLRLEPAAGAAGTAFITIAVRDSAGATGRAAFQCAVVAVDDTDSDDDGVPDVKELRAGTDPRNKKDFFGFPQAPKPRVGGAWSITINTVPGRTYVLQSADLSIGLRWNEVARVKASGVVTTLEDPSSVASRSRLYRTVLLEERPADEVPPQIASLRVTADSPGRYRLSVSASDASGIRAVEFFDGGMSLGRAVAGTDGTWSLEVPMAVNSVHQIRALVTDLAGNSGSTEDRGVFLADPNYVAPIAGDGPARYGEVVMLSPEGRLPAVEIRPAGSDPLGAGNRFAIRAPAGGRVLVTSSGPLLEFEGATGAFGETAVLRLPEPLVRADGGSVRVPVGPMSVQQILAAFGRPAGEGLPLQIFGRVPVRWMEGTLEPGGIRGGRFKLELPGIPVPGDSVRVAELVLELDSRQGVRLPFSGEVELPSRADGTVRLAIPASRPLVLWVRPDGSMAVEGRGALEFKDGPRFTVDVALNDPFYALQISAEKLQLPMLDSLYPQLPSPGTAPAAGATAAQLDEAARRLGAVWCAYRHFAASAAPCGGDAAGATPALNLPPTPASVVEAWAYAARADSGLVGAMLGQAEMFTQTARAALASRDLVVACQYHLALLRARLSASAVQAGAIEPHLRSARLALVRLAGDPEAVRDLSTMSAIAACLLEAELLAQQVGGAAADAALTSAVRGLVTRFVDAEVGRYEIVDGPQGPSSARIAEMDRYEALQSLMDTLAVQRLAQQVGADSTLVVGALRRIAQVLGVHTWRLANAGLTDAELARDYPQFTAALAEVMAVIAVAQADAFDETALGNPSTVGLLQGAAARLEAVFRSDANKGFRVEHLASLLKELRGLLAVLRDARTPVESWRPWAQALFTRCDRVVGQAILRERAEPGSLTAQDLVTLLCVGTSQAELGERFGFAGEGSWEQERLGQVVGFLREAPGRTWVNLHDAVDCLLTEAAQMRGGSGVARRQAALAAATTLLTAERELVSGLWAVSKACGDSAWTALADMVLPGDILVDEVAGAASFNRETRLLRGAFRGRLRIPGFGGEFTVNNASFDTTGAFDLSATGGLALPSAEDARLRLTVPADRPLHIAVRPPGRVAMSGSLKVELNGMTFEAYASLDDPLYVVGAAARGLQFDVMNVLRPALPVLEAGRVYDPATLRELTALYGSFSRGLQGLVGAGAPAAGVAKTSLHLSSADTESGIPEFSLPSVEAAVFPAAALLQSILADGRLGVARNYDALVEKFTNQMSHLSRRLAVTEFRPADISSLQSVSNEVVLVERLARVTVDASHPSQSWAQALTRGDTFREYLSAIESFLARQVRGVTTLEDPKERRRVEDLLRLAERFALAARGFTGYTLTSLRDAFSSFVQSDRFHRTFEFYGLNPNTGQPIPGGARFESLTTFQLKEGLVVLLKIQQVAQLTGMDSESGWPDFEVFLTAMSNLRSRLRQLYLAEYDEVIPADWVRIQEVLKPLHVLSDHPTGILERTDSRLRLLEPLLQKYRDANRLTRELVSLAKAGLDLGIANFDVGAELDAASHRLLGALLFANSVDTNGVNRLSGGSYEIKVRTSAGADGGLRLCRPDLEALMSGVRRGDMAASTISGSEISRIFEESVAKLAPCIMEQVDLDAQTYKVATPASRAVEQLTSLGLWAATNSPAQAAQAVSVIQNVLRRFLPPGASGSLTPATVQNARVLSSAELVEVNRLLIEMLERPELPSDSVVRQAVLAEANRLVRAQAEQAATLAGRLVAVPPLDMLLPGGVHIDSVFGEVTFDRVARSLAARFGGQLAFPSLADASFEITEATLDNAFNFSLLASAAGLRLGPAELVQGTLRVNGNPGQRYFGFAGSGRMRFSGGADVGVSIAYLPETRELVFATEVGNDSGVIRLSDNLVLFKAGLGLRLSTERPAGDLTNSATVGLFARRPLSDPPQEDDFHMVVRNARTVLSTDLAALRGSFAITGGELLLPSGFTAGACETTPGAAGFVSVARPLVGIHPDRPITAALTLRPGSTAASLQIESLTLGGTVTVERVGLRPAGLAGFGAEICRGELMFPSLQLGSGMLSVATLPKFTLLEGAVSVPLPPGQTNYLVTTNVVFDLEGLPTGTVFLRDDVKLMDLSTFNFTLLGGDSCGAGLPATGLRVVRERDKLAVTLSGGIRVGIPASVMQTNAATSGSSATVSSGTGGATTNGVEMTACASVTLREGALPELDVRTLGIAGNFNFAGGIPIEGASITLSNLHQLFNLSPDVTDPFTIAISGTIFAPNGPGFGLRDTRFVFNNLNPDLPGLPQFIPGTLVYDGSRWALRQYLPIFVERAEFTFKDGTRPFPEILNPTNLVITTTASISLPTPNDPVLGGSVRDLAVTFLADGTPVFSLDGIGLDIQPGKLKLPPINDLGGRLYIGGLSDPVRHPERLFFAGKLTGTYSEMKLGFLGAFTMAGPIGLCLDVKGGSLGIPLPLGFVINGASGGVSLLNNNSNPCDIRGYIDSQSGRPTGEPPADTAPMSWTQVKAFVDRFEQRARQLGQSVQTSLPVESADPPSVSLLSASTYARGIAADEPGLAATGEESTGTGSEPGVETVMAGLHSGGLTIPCPGDCPPYTVNIFCQPHPDTARFGRRVILKFSSIEESVLNRFGITEANLQALLDQGIRTSSGLGAALARQMKTNLMASVKLPPAATPATALFDELFANFENGMAQAIQTTLGTTPGAANVIYSNVVYAAYAGLPCQDVTYVVSGSFSHAAIGMFLSITGEALLSTSGTAGVSGRVNFIGLPVGTGKVFVTGTDDRGIPDPALCGEINVAVGPLELGALKAALQCDGCVAGLSSIAANLIVGLGGDVVRNILREIAPQLADLSQAQLAALITAGSQTINGVTVSFPVELQTAFLGVLLQAGPEILPANAREQFISAVEQALDVFNPEVVLCGEVLPKLFGIPMGTKAASVSYRVSRNGRQALVGFAPSTVLRWLTDPRFAPPEFDAATLGYNEPLPAEEFKAAILAGLRGDLLDPQRAARFAKDQFGRFLERNTMTATYELTPLGLSLARAAGRAVMPDFTRHPVVHGFSRPETRGLPSRPQLLMAMLRAEPPVLGNPFWFGRDNDLPGLYPAGSPTAIQLAGKTLTRDYFPHGGFVGAGYIDVPRALYDPPPAELATALNPQTNAFARLAAALTYVTEYVLKTTNAGQLAFYLPAPNPPRDLVQAPEIDVEAVLQAMNRFQPPPTGLHGLNQQIYPLQEAFLNGYLSNRVLGVDIGTATVEGVPPGNGRDAYLRGDATMSNDPRNWLRHFASQASIRFEISQSPTQSVQRAFAGWRDVLAQPTNGLTASAVTARLTPFLNRFYDQMPKASLTATLTGVGLSQDLRDRLGRLLSVPPGSGDLELAAYSPRFDPNEAAGNPMAVIRKNGGVAMRGRLSLGNLVTNTIELAVLPKPYDPLATTVPPDLLAEVNAPSLPLAPGLTLSQATLKLDTRTPSLTVTGQVGTIDLGPVLKIQPLSGSQLTAGFSMSPAGQGVQLSLPPAQLQSAFLLGSGRSLLIHGAASTTTPFTFSTTTEWSATVSFRDNEPLELRAPDGKILFRVARNDVGAMSLRRFLENNAWVSEVRIDIPSGREVTFLPADPLEQRFRFGANQTLVARSDGAARFSGTLQSDFNLAGLGGLPVQFVRAGAGIVFERLITARTAEGVPSGYEVRLTASGSLGGGMLRAGTVSAATSQLRIALPGGVSLSGNVTVPGLDFGGFSLTPSGATSFDALLDPNGLRIASTTACLSLLGSSIACFPLNAVGTASDTGSASGGEVTLASSAQPQPLRILLPTTNNFSINSGSVSASLFDFQLGSASFTLVRRGGVVSLSPFVGTLTLPVIGGSSRVRGDIQSDGLFRLESEQTFSVPNIAGQAIGSLNSARAVLRRYLQPRTGPNGIALPPIPVNSLRLEGTMAGGAIAQFSPIGAASGWLELSTTAITDGELSVGGIGFGSTGLALRARDGQPLTAEIDAADLRWNARPVRLTFNNVTVSDFDLPGFGGLNGRLDLRNALPAAGDWAWNVGPTTAVFHGISLGSANFLLGRQGGVLGLHNFSGSTASFPIVGSMSFSGRLVTSALDLRASPALPKIGGFDTAHVEFQITSEGIVQRNEIELSIGKIGWIGCDSFKVTPSGLTFKGKKGPIDNGWERKFNFETPISDPRGGDVYGRIRYDLEFDVTNFSSGNLSLRVSGTVGAWADPGAGDQPGSVFDVPLRITLPIPPAPTLELTTPTLEVPLPGGAAWQPIRDRLSNLKFTLW